MKKVIQITYAYDDGTADIQTFPPDVRNPLPEQVFLDTVNTLIRNFFVDNPNFNNGYYYNERISKGELISDIKSSGNFILERIKDISHLIIPNY